MDVVKNQVARIQQQLSSLTASQKMLTGALVIIMLMTMLYWGRQAGTAAMEPVLDQPIAKEDMGPIVARLKGMGIEATVKGDRILVPADRVWEALADLAYSRLLPANSETGFDQKVAKLSPWASPAQRASLENRGKEITCAQIIGLFPDVRQAQVIIDPTRTRKIGGASIEPSAAIHITMRDAGSVRKVAQAAVSVVTGALAGLSPAHVHVVVNGEPQRIPVSDKDGLAMGDDQLDLMLKHQQTVLDSIHASLSYVPEVRVAVSIKLNRDIVETEEQVIDAENTVSKLKSEESENSETREGGPPAQEPGASPKFGNLNGTANGMLEIPSAGGGGGILMQTNKEKSEFDNLPSFKKIRTQSAAGEATVVSASVRVPRSYFVRVLQQRHPDRATDEAGVAALAEKGMKEMEAAVRASAGMDEKALVSVAQFDDLVQLASPPGPPTAAMSIPLVLGNHPKEIALGGLALLSLFMVSMIVRKSAPAPVLVAAGAAFGGASPLARGEALAGEAAAGSPAPDALEPESEAVRIRQMLDQVSMLVSDNPAAAASLVQRWLNRN